MALTGVSRHTSPFLVQPRDGLWLRLFNRIPDILMLVLEVLADASDLSAELRRRFPLAR